MKKHFLICCLRSLCVLYKKPVIWVVLAAIVVVAAVSVGLLLSTNNDKDNGNGFSLETMSAIDIVSVLSNLGYPAAGGKDYDEPGDMSQYPWNITGCTSAAEFWIPDGTADGQSSGYVEVYNSVEACKERRNHAAAISSFYPVEPYYIQVGKVFIQVPKALPEKSAAEYKTALTAMAEGKIPEAFPEGITHYTGQWTGYIATFPKYDYTGAKDASFADRHFELKDVPQNTPENLVAMDFYYDIAGEYDKLYDLCGSEALKISAVSTKKLFEGGSYIQEYKVKQLSTLPFATFANLDASLLKSIKSSIETNKLTEYTLVQADFKMTRPTGWWQAQAELSDGDHTFYFLCGKTQGDHVWKLYEVYWG